MVRGHPADVLRRGAHHQGLEVTADGDRADVKVLVNSEARTWTPPAAKSEHFAYDAGQTWEVRRSPETGAPVIVRYTVDTFTPAAPAGS